MNRINWEEQEDQAEDQHYDESDIDDALGLEEAQETDTQASLSEAQARIEQANLYQTLISHSLFAPNSARPEIMTLVEGEIRAFALERLEILLGMRQAQAKVQKVESPFSEEEVAALKAIAGRLNKAPQPSMPVERTPGLNAVGAAPVAPAPAIRQVAAPAPKPAVVARPKAPAAPVQPKAAPQPKKPRGTRSRKMEDTVVSPTGSNRNYSQAVNPANKPIPMPREIHVTSTSGIVSSGDGAFNMNQLSGAVMDAMAANAHIKE